MDITIVPLNQLIKADTNVRQDDHTENDVAGLAMSILAEDGLIHPLTGFQKSKKRVAIYAGSGRLAALNKLQAEGKLPETLKAGIPVVIKDTGRTDQISTSLAENFERAPLSPMDQFEAFKSLSDEGLSLDDICRRFGVSEKLVKQRLALANVAPVIVTAFRANEIGLAQMQAYTIEPDAAVQERVFTAISRQAHPGAIRRMLTESETPITSQFVTFIGIEAYEAAGGNVKRDLFDDELSSLTDNELLFRLCDEKLGEYTGAIETDGWKWVETHPSVDYDFLQNYKRVYPVEPELTEDQEARVGEINSRIEEIEELLAVAYDADHSDTDEAQEAIKALENEAQSLESEHDVLTDEIFTDALKSNAGVIITINRTGDTHYHYGLVRPDDVESVKAESVSENGSSSDTVDKSNALSNALFADINSATEAAVQREISKQFSVAFLVSTAHLAQSVFFGAGNKQRALSYAPTLSFTQSPSVPMTSEEWLHDQIEMWKERLDPIKENLVSGLASWKTGDVQDLHGFCAGTLYRRSSVNPNQEESVDAHSTFAELLNFDLQSHYAMTSVVLGRFTKPQLNRVNTDLGSGASAALSKGPKGDLLAFTETAALKANWLPACAGIVPVGAVISEPEVSEDAE